jgi:hypothetical protein
MITRGTSKCNKDKTSKMMKFNEMEDKSERIQKPEQ